MRKGVIVSLLLHALALAPLLLIYAPQLSAPSSRESAPQTRFVAQTVNIEALRPTPVPVTAAAPPIEAPQPVVSEAEQAIAVAPVEPETVELSKPEPPPEPEVAKAVEPAPLPEPETLAQAKPEKRAKPPPEPEPPPQPEPPPEVPAEVKPPAAKPQPPAQDEPLAMMDETPVSPAPSSAPRHGAAADQSAESDADYLVRIRALIEQQKRYPPMALRLGMEGEVRLWFVLDRQGRVLDYRIDQGSGHAMLDEEVERLIRQIATFPPVPPDMGVDRLELVVPISFQLAG